jgi:hypothetical protein
MAGLFQSAFPCPWAHALLGDDIDFPAQEKVEIPPQAAQVQQAAAGFQIYQQINIACFVPFSASPRAKDTGFCH